MTTFVLQGEWGSGRDQTQSSQAEFVRPVRGEEIWVSASDYFKIRLVLFQGIILKVENFPWETENEALKSETGKGLYILSEHESEANSFGSVTDSVMQAWGGQFLLTLSSLCEKKYRDKRCHFSSRRFSTYFFWPPLCLIDTYFLIVLLNLGLRFHPSPKMKCKYLASRCHNFKCIEC